MANRPSLPAIPPLDGRLLRAAPLMAAASTDFGKLLSGPPSAILRPRSIRDIARMVEFSRDHGLKLAARGQGYSIFGQTLVPGGISIEMRSLDISPRIKGNRLEIGVGATWREALAATLPHGKRPAVLPGFLGLTVGGTLSVGGIGGESFRHGAVVDQVLGLEAVTGAGDRIACSPDRVPDLFASLLGGLGQCGIMTRATLKLVPAQRKVLAFSLEYLDLDRTLADCRFLLAGGRFDKLVAYATPLAPGRWRFSLEAALYHSASRPPRRKELLDGLNPLSVRESAKGMPYFEYADRLQAYIDGLIRRGEFGLPQPWLDLFIPDSRINEFAESLLAGMKPAGLGPNWPILIYPLRSEPFRRPLLRMPREGILWLFDLLSSARRPAAARRMVERNRDIFERARALGGKHYPISAVPLDSLDWKRHFHPEWQRFRRAKRKFDPDNLLTPGPGIFA